MDGIPRKNQGTIIHCPLGTEISDQAKYHTLFKDTIYCKLTWIINLFQLLLILRQEN